MKIVGEKQKREMELSSSDDEDFSPTQDRKRSLHMAYSGSASSINEKNNDEKKKKLQVQFIEEDAETD